MVARWASQFFRKKSKAESASGDGDPTALKLYFLGTSAGVPAHGRNVSGMALQFEQRPDWYLFDCGEGTQHQVQNSPLSLARLSRIFISHLHGDHWFGLPGLLSSRSLLGAEGPVELFGPAGLKEVLDHVLAASDAHISYDLTVTEITAAGQELVTEPETITSIPQSHNVTCYGFLINEAERPGTFDVEAARRLGIPEGPIYGRLKAGEVVTLDDGRVVSGHEFIGAPQPGRRLLIAGDNDRPRVLLKHLKGVHLLVHEATHTDKMVAAARGEGGRHSTARQVAQAADSTGVPNLVLTHFSARFTDRDGEVGIDDLRQEAAGAYGGRLFMAEDHAQFELSREGKLRRR